MTLGVHGVIGAAVASLVPGYPVAGIAAAFASHFAADMVPQRDYSIRSPSLHPDHGSPVRFDRALFIDLAKVGTDALLGIVVSVLLFSDAQFPWYIALAAFAGMAPDLIHIIEPRFKWRPLVALQAFHRRIQSEPESLKPHPLLGLFLQGLFALAVVLLAKAITG